MHILPTDIEEQLVNFILNPDNKIPDTAAHAWQEGHDKPINTDSQSQNWLGSHQDMASPGKITLYRDNLNQAFWSFVNSQKPAPIHHRNLCRSLIYMVLVHERFHHFCDVYGQITQYRGGAKNDPSQKQSWQKEEALATVWEWQELQRSCSSFSALPKDLQSAWIDWWFVGITVAGYRDWQKYRHSCLFKEALREHLIPLATNLISTANAELTEWLFLQLVNPQWCDNAVIYHVSATGGQAPLSPPDFPSLHATSVWIENGTSQPLCRMGKTDLKDIHNKPPEKAEPFPDVLCLNGNPITSSVLGLLLIPELERVCCTGLSGDLLKAIQIVNPYLHLSGGKSTLFDCQTDLLNADLAEFAQR